MSAPLKCSVHDRPAAANCERCSRPACASCLMVAENGRLLCDACALCVPRAGGNVPWDALAANDSGLVPAFFKSIWRLLHRTSASFESLRDNASPGPALTFGLLMLVPGFPLAYVGGSAFTAQPLLGTLAIMFLFGLVWLGLLPLVEYGLLRMSGAPGASFAVQVRAAGYSLAPLALGVVPIACCAVLPGCVLLKLVASHAMYREGKGQALLAMMLAPLLLAALAAALRLDAWVAAWFF